MLTFLAGNLVKLGDFGIARTLNSQSQLAHTVVGCVHPVAYFFAFTAFVHLT